VNELAIDLEKVTELPDMKLVGFCREPLKWQRFMYKTLGDQCPLCGSDTELSGRSPISFDLTAIQGLPFGHSFWAHDECIDECPETELAAGIPW